MLTPSLQGGGALAPLDSPIQRQSPQPSARREELRYAIEEMTELRLLTFNPRPLV